MRYILGALVLLALGFTAGKYSTSAQVKEVEKIVYREQTDVKKNVNRVTTIKPDGTKVTELQITTDKRTTVAIDDEKSRTTTNRPNWRVGVTYEPQIIMFQSQSVALDIQRHIIGELYIGAAVSTQKTIGLSVSMGF